MDGLSELANHIDVGRIPILSTTGTFAPISNQPMIDPRGIAASLAISAVAMSLPATKAANETEILEAREKLRDHLPPFWAAMLKLSADLAKKLGANASAKDVQREVSASVNTIVRPALIELLRKLDLEKKDRFKNILRSAAGAMRVLAGKPPTDLAGLVSGSIMAGTDVALDFADQLRKIENLKRESGLTYLIEAAKTFRGQT
jgi:hypothetical protein